MKRLFLLLLFLMVGWVGMGRVEGASIVRYVNTASSGGDGTTNNISGADAAFASLSAAEDALDGTAFGAGETCTINCSGSTADTTAVTFDSWDADVTIKIYGDNTSGKWDTSKYRLAVSGAYALRFARAVQLYNVQISLDPTANDQRAITFNWYDTNPLILDGCILRSLDTDGTYITQGIYTEWSQPIILRNTVIYDFCASSWSSAVDLNAATTITLQNCTIYNCGEVGLRCRNSGATMTVTNCAVFGNADDFYQASGTLTISYCASDDGDGSNAVNISPGATESTDWANAFTDYANGDFHVKDASSVLYNAGTDLSGSFTTDIDGATRSGTWDIGADELASGSGTNTVVKIILGE